MTDEKTINIGAGARLSINIGAGAGLTISTGAGPTITVQPRRIRVDTREQMDLRESAPHPVALAITELPRIRATASDDMLAEAERHIDAAREAAGSITGHVPTLAELPAAIEACKAALRDAKQRGRRSQAETRLTHNGVASCRLPLACFKARAQSPKPAMCSPRSATRLAARPHTSARARTRASPRPSWSCS